MLPHWFESRVSHNLPAFKYCNSRRSRNRCPRKELICGMCEDFSYRERLAQIDQSSTGPDQKRHKSGFDQFYHSLLL